MADDGEGQRSGLHPKTKRDPNIKIIAIKRANLRVACNICAYLALCPWENTWPGLNPKVIQVLTASKPNDRGALPLVAAAAYNYLH